MEGQKASIVTRFTLPDELFLFYTQKDPADYGFPKMESGPLEKAHKKARQDLKSRIHQFNPKFRDEMLVLFPKSDTVLNQAYEYVFSPDDYCEQGRFTESFQKLYPVGEFIDDIILGNRKNVYNRNLFNTIVEFSKDPIYPEALRYLENQGKSGMGYEIRMFDIDKEKELKR